MEILEIFFVSFTKDNGVIRKLEMVELKSNMVDLKALDYVEGTALEMRILRDFATMTKRLREGDCLGSGIWMVEPLELLRKPFGESMTKIEK